MRTSRRAWLGLTAGALALGLGRRARADREGLGESLDFDLRDVEVAGDRALGRRFTLLTPRHLGEGERVPLLVLLHGLGETGDERAGVFAWLERYGLGTSYARLRRPPIVKTSKRADWTAERLAETNQSLAQRPFRGLVIACPYTPNVARSAAREGALDAYGRWITEVVVPRARREAVAAHPERTTLDGCSLGGYVGLEVFLRHPEAFQAWGGVQSAFGAARAAAYADRLGRAFASVGPRDLHLLTSTGDPFLQASTSLHRELSRKNIACSLVVLPGPHDQPWLREAGTIEMLLWHDRRPR